MPFSALPPHLHDIENNFPDDSQFGTESWFGRAYRKFNKATKTWFAFSYRCTEWWAKWRKFPIVLFAVGGQGPWRWESDGKGEVIDYNHTLSDKSLQNLGYYLSRIQYYKRWAIIIQWPLLFTVHFYYKPSDVPVFGIPRPSVKGKVWFGYFNHYDADNIYWMVTSGFLGRTFK